MVLNIIKLNVEIIENNVISLIPSNYLVIHVNSSIQSFIIPIVSLQL